MNIFIFKKVLKKDKMIVPFPRKERLTFLQLIPGHVSIIKSLNYKLAITFTDHPSLVFFLLINSFVLQQSLVKSSSAEIGQLS